MCLLSAVLNHCFSFLKFCLCVASRVLKSFSVSPTYVSVLFSLLSHSLFVVEGAVVVVKARKTPFFGEVLCSVAFVCCFIFVSHSTDFYKKYSRYLKQTFRHNL